MDIILKYWPIITTFVIVIVWLAKISFEVQAIKTGKFVSNGTCLERQKAIELAASLQFKAGDDRMVEISKGVSRVEGKLDDLIVTLLKEKT